MLDNNTCIGIRGSDNYPHIGILGILHARLVARHAMHAIKCILSMHKHYGGHHLDLAQLAVCFKMLPRAFAKITGLGNDKHVEQ